MPIEKYYQGHGDEVMSSMKKTYKNKGGEKKAKEVFYATANKRKANPGQRGGMGIGLAK